VTLVVDLLAKKSPTLSNTQIFAGTTDESMQFSGKGGASFVACGGLQPPNALEVFSVARDPVTGVVLVGTNRGVFSSSDVGIATPPNFTQTNFNFDAVFSMDADKTQSVIYAGTLSDGVWISTDDLNFTKATISRPNPTVFALAHDGGTVPSTILAGVTSQYENTVFVTTDKGMHFNESATGIDDFGGSLKAMNNSLAGISQQSDAFVTEIDPTGSGISFSSYLGGTSFDAGSGVAVDSKFASDLNGSIFLTGTTFSTNFPDAGNFGGLVNGYAARIGTTPESTVTTTPTASATSTSSGSPTPTATGATSTPTPSKTATATPTASPTIGATPTATPTMVPEKLTVKPKKLNFGKVKTGAGSNPKNISVSLKKRKNAVPIFLFGPGGSPHFAFSTTCPGSLPPGGKCKYSVTFNPDKPGPVSGSFLIFFNGIGSPVMVQLTGTGD
jgi:hypothetical protein